jgi:HTH-type transcriptional regulator/antitoxin HigA
MDIKPIRTEADYRATLREIESLMDVELDSPEGEKLDVLTTLVEAYEAKHYPMELPDAVEAIKFEMERRGLTVKDLEPMIWKLHEELGIPAESLIKPPQAKAGRS